MRKIRIVTLPSTGISVSACILATSLIAGCAGTAPEPEGETMTLLARVELEGGSVSFYEPEPGTVIEEQTGLIRDATLRLGTDLSFTQRYELLAGAPAPAALVAAEKRAGAGGPASTSADGKTTFAEGTLPNVDDVANIDKVEPPTVEWFIASYCERQDRFFGSYEEGTDFLGTGWTGDSWWEGSGLNYLKTGVFTISGEMIYRFTWTGGDGAAEQSGQNKVVSEGHYIGHRVKSIANRSGSSKVSFADGDVYHHCVNFHF